MFSKLLFAIAAAMMCASCMHGPLPNLPKDWAGVVVPPKALEDKADVADMQLFIMHGSIGCSHTAIRFHCPGKGALFWDPGGGYGNEGFVTVTKHYNVVTRNVPTANDYLHWRTLIQPDTNLPQFKKGRRHEQDHRKPESRLQR